MSAKLFIWGDLHRLSMTLKIRKKLCMRGSSRRLDSTPFLSIPAPKSIVHTIECRSVLVLAMSGHNHQRIIGIEHQRQQA